MTLQSDLEAAVADAQADSQKLKDIVNGPAEGATSLVEVASGWVKTVARAIAEIGDVGLHALKDLSNVLVADFFDAAVAADVAGNMRKADNLAGLTDPAGARDVLGLGAAATKAVDVEGGVQSFDADTLKADADDVLVAAFGQPYEPLGSLDAMADDVLVITTLSGSNRKSLAVDVDGEIDVSGMASGGVKIRATNAGARSLTFTGATLTEGSATFNGMAGAVNIMTFESDGTTVDLTIDQRGA